MRNSERLKPEINSSSMADIAFLLLVFFLVTTTIVDDRGLFLILPPDDSLQPVAKIPERNLFTIEVNSRGDLLVEGKIYEKREEELKREIIGFIMNGGKVAGLSDDPKSAVVSLKAYRGASHGRYIEILDVIKSAYHSIYAERAGVTLEEWRKIADNHDDEPARSLYKRGRGEAEKGTDIPMNISIVND